MSGHLLETKAGVCPSLKLGKKLGRDIELAWAGPNALYLRSLGESIRTEGRSILGTGMMFSQLSLVSSS